MVTIRAISPHVLYPLHYKATPNSVQDQWIPAKLHKHMLSSTIQFLPFENQSRISLGMENRRLVRTLCEKSLTVTKFDLSQDTTCIL